MKRQPMTWYADGSPCALAKMGPPETHLEPRREVAQNERGQMLRESAGRSQ